jgi:hypothetical protein
VRGGPAQGEREKTKTSGAFADADFFLSLFCLPHESAFGLSASRSSASRRRALLAASAAALRFLVIHQYWHQPDCLVPWGTPRDERNSSARLAPSLDMKGTAFFFDARVSRLDARVLFSRHFAVHIADVVKHAMP